MVVSDAQLGRFQYGQDDGTIQYVQVSITILANNNKSKADASFSRFELALGLHDAEVALLRSLPFVVPGESSLPLQFNVVSTGRPLDPAGMRDMRSLIRRLGDEGHTVIAEGSPFVAYHADQAGSLTTTVPWTRQGESWTTTIGDVTYGLVVANGTVSERRIDLEQSGVIGTVPVF